MAKLVIELAPTDTGKVLADFTWDFCKKIVDGTAVSTAGCALVELGNGFYVLSNPNVTTDAAFRIHLTADATKYTSGIFSLADDDIARQSTLLGIPTNPVLTNDVRLAHLDADVSSRNAVAPDNAGIAAIKAKTDNLPASPAVAGEYDASLAAIKAKTDNLPANPAAVGSAMTVTGYVAPDNAGIAAIKAKTDNLPASPAAVGSAMTLTGVYDAAKTAASAASVAAIPTNPVLATDARLSYLDASISSISVTSDNSAVLDGLANILAAVNTRLAAADYITPENTAILNGLSALLTAINTRLAASAYVAPDNGSLSTILDGISMVLDAIQALPANQDDGGSTLTAAEIWSYATRSLTDKAGFAPTVSQVQAGLVTTAQLGAANALILEAIGGVPTGGSGGSTTEGGPHVLTSFDIAFEQGEDFSHDLTFKAEDGSLIDISNWQFDGAIRRLDNNALIATFVCTPDIARAMLSYALPSNVTRSIKSNVQYTPIETEIASRNPMYYFDVFCQIGAVRTKVRKGFVTVYPTASQI